MKKLCSSSLVPQKGQIRVWLSRTPDRALEIQTVRPKAGRLVTPHTDVLTVATETISKRLSMCHCLNLGKLFILPLTVEI